MAKKKKCIITESNIDVTALKESVREIARLAGGNADDWEYVEKAADEFIEALSLVERK